MTVPISVTPVAGLWLGSGGGGALLLPRPRHSRDLAARRNRDKRSRSPGPEPDSVATAEKEERSQQGHPFRHHPVAAGLSSGAASAGLSLVGLRGATLAATGPFLAGAAAAISLGKALQIATSFQSELSVFAATTGATAEQMERVSEAARRVGP